MKKDRILELYREGKSVREILEAMSKEGLHVWDSYVRTTIKNYKLEQQVKNLIK